MVFVVGSAPLFFGCLVVCVCVGCLFCAWGWLVPVSSGLLAGDECASFL